MVSTREEARTTFPNNQRTVSLTRFTTPSSQCCNCALQVSKPFLLVFFLGAVFSAILYGVFCFDSITAQPGAAPSVFKTRLSILSTIISIGILIFGLLAQRFISRITDE
jgi:hypothetical protein